MHNRNNGGATGAQHYQSGRVRDKEHYHYGKQANPVGGEPQSIWYLDNGTIAGKWMFIEGEREGLGGGYISKAIRTVKWRDLKTCGRNAAVMSKASSNTGVNIRIVT